MERCREVSTERRDEAMGVVWGVVIVVLSGVCWGGQVISVVAPDTAARWGLQEAERDVDPAFAADGRGEALWDLVTLWTMPLAGVLLVLDNPSWPYFGLVGGGTYLYFAGRGVTARVVMRRRGIRIGSADNVRIGLLALTVWGLMAVITIVAAVVALEAA